METNQVVFCVIVFLVIVIIVLAYYVVKNSKEVKRLYLNNKLRDALNKGITINFNEYSLAALEFFENQINDSFVQIFEKRIEDVAYLIKSIDRVKDYAKREYLKNLITATVINRVEVKKLAKLIFTNMSDYLRYIKINKFHLSSELIEAESIRYLKFNSFILLNLDDTSRLELINDINELIDKYEAPSFGDEPMKKWFQKEMPILLKAESAKIKMHIGK